MELARDFPPGPLDIRKPSIGTMSIRGISVDTKPWEVGHPPGSQQFPYFGYIMPSNHHRVNGPSLGSQVLLSSYEVRMALAQVAPMVSILPTRAIHTSR